MGAIFSKVEKYTHWRRLWIALAKGEQELGLPITSEQIEEMESRLGPIDFERVQEIERETEHDVMAHILAYGEQCPKAKGILHLGATSAFVTDNGDLLQIRAGLELLIERAKTLLQTMGSLALDYAAFPTLAWTHLQPAQPTTVGKRIGLWIQDFLMDTEDLILREKQLQFLGVKGATGSQASFLSLFDGDVEKVKKLDRRVAELMGFDRLFVVSGQTYTRKQDQQILNVLEGFAASAHKCATDLRLLAHMEEMEEGKGEKQVGSSAMPHKRNPILAERVCSLSRFLISLTQNGAYTLSTQWLERSLDDSANRRLVLPQAFLTADAILILLQKIFSEIRINPEKIEKHLKEKMPLLQKETLLMEGVKQGMDRQELHERLRTASPEEMVKLCQQLKLEKAPPQLLRCQQQVEELLKQVEQRLSPLQRAD